MAALRFESMGSGDGKPMSCNVRSRRCRIGRLDLYEVEIVLEE